MCFFFFFVFLATDAEFRNTGLERSEKLAKDLEWFKEQGHTIPEPSSPGVTYACYLEELAEKDPQAFICHFYNIYFAHSAGGRMIGKKVNNYNIKPVHEITYSSYGANDILKVTPFRNKVLLKNYIAPHDI